MARKTKAPKRDYPPLKVFWFSDAALSEGVTTVVLDGIEVLHYARVCHVERVMLPYIEAIQ